MLDAGKVTVDVLRLSRKEPLSDDDARALLSSVDEVIVARGKTTRTLTAAEASVDDLRGNSGGIRAPILRVGRRLLVGFHEATLKDVLS